MSGDKQTNKEKRLSVPYSLTHNIWTYHIVVFNGDIDLTDQIVSECATATAARKKKKRTNNGSSKKIAPIHCHQDEVFAVFCDTFEDGLAIIDADGRYAFVNDSYRKLHDGIRDLIHVGASYNDVLKRGLELDAWDLASKDATSWLETMSFAQDHQKLETCLALSSGRWLLRRRTPHASGMQVEICSDLTSWKNKENEMHEALERAEDAEEQSHLALQREESRKHEEEMLSQLNHWLHSCKKLSELKSIVESFLLRLLPNSQGALYIYNNSRDVLVPTCSWNLDEAGSEIKADDCWGLRQGRAYHYGMQGLRFACDHTGDEFKHDENSEYYCIPILAHGDTAGMLHVRPCEKVRSETHLGERSFKIACKCAEQISLAIANVKLSQELKDQSTKDPLTGLFNRRYFAERCSREITRTQQGSVTSSLLYLDLDHFKRFNDNFGHDAGDIVLKGFARLMTDHFRGSDVVSRLGGEEFAVLLPNASREIAVERAEELLPKVQMMEIRYGNEILPSITTSIGAIEFPNDGSCLEDIFKSADTALYAAKKAGRNQVL